MFAKDKAFDILGVPTDRVGYERLVTFGYPTGKWGVAAAAPVHEVSSYNHWNTAVPFEIPEPLWSK